MPNTIAYLDHNATRLVKPAARAAMLAALQLGGNPSSVHRQGRLARRAVERARAQVAALVGATPDRVVFTSGATEANQLALLGCGERRRLVSAIEHESVLAADPAAARLPVDGNGVIDLGALEQALAGTPALVSLMLANNETGVVQPVAAAAAIAHRHGALLHCDAVQAPGRLPLDIAALGVDLMTLSAHKLGGPQGAGALVLGEGVEITARLAGGGQESGRRAGTENVPGIVGFGAAAELAAEDLATISKVAALRDGLERQVRQALPTTVIFAAGAQRLANTSCLAMPGVAAETQVMALDLAGAAVSAGAACSSGKVRASAVLKAMGVADGLAASAIRVSLGPETEAWEIERFVAAWLALWGRAGGRRQDATGVGG